MTKVAHLVRLAEALALANQEAAHLAHLGGERERNRLTVLRALAGEVAAELAEFVRRPGAAT